jgi:hypothetical protein
MVKNLESYIGNKLPNIEKNLLHSFSRQRVFIRIKFLNEQKNMSTSFHGKRKQTDDTQRKTLNKMRKIVH